MVTKKTLQQSAFFDYADFGYTDFGSCLRLRSGTAGTATTTSTAAYRTSASLSISYFDSAQYSASANLAVAKHNTGLWKWPLARDIIIIDSAVAYVI
jgi:hypothetical protein